ncbi:MAG: hypothetical protein R3258_02450 [Acidimicrobiia bacterium]|nr:hypothetical protein [Acidimicrobiia bacterium]
MREEILGLLDKADMAIASCVGVVGDDALAPVAEIVANARVRLSYPDEVLVMAAAGGTGSGKSSIANALTGDEIARVGGLRPTTVAPLAIVPARFMSRMAGYLDSIGVRHVEPHDRSDWLCVIDMPDTDSVELEHRHQVDNLLPHLDVVVWILDPEKYRDASLHHRYIAPLAAYASQFVFALNHADRLAADDLEDVVVDLQAALLEDGIEAGTVFVTSANPPSGPLLGVDALSDHLKTLAATRTGLYDKLLVDMEQAAVALIGETGGTGLDYRSRSKAVMDSASKLIASGLTGRAVDALKGFAEGLADAAGGVTKRAILDLQASYPGVVQEIHERVSRIRPAEERWKIRWSPPPPDTSEGKRITEALDLLVDSIGKPLAELLRQRAVCNAALVDLSVSIESLKARSRM